MDKPKITICVGSSCYARGNAKAVDIVEKYLEDHNLKDEIDVELTGSLCTNNCSDGPIVIINDKVHRHVDSGALVDLLNEVFKK